MDNNVIIVMYHFVKAQNPSGLERFSITADIFDNQLNLFTENYNIITPTDFIRALNNKIKLPNKAVLLTFDDGYTDHYENVFPLLSKRNLKAFFFPSAKPLLEGKILNTNKIQLIMDFAKDKEKLFSDFLKLLQEVHRIRTGLEPKAFNEIDSNYMKENFISILERDSFNVSSSTIVDRLFEKYVPCNEKELATELYMNMKQLKEMRDYGMHIGCHSYSHYWMSSLKPIAQAREILKSLELLRRVNGDKRGWVMCYPYGVFNESLIRVVKAKGCIAGFTTAGGTANLLNQNRFTLPRCNITKLQTTKS